MDARYHRTCEPSCSRIWSLGLLQEHMARDPALGRVLAVKTAGTLDERGWANELHPTPRGFMRLVERKFLPALDGIDLASSH
jgi:hypothetical protein